MQLYPRALTRLLVPMAIIGLAALLPGYAGSLGNDASVLLANLPYFLCLIVAAMAVQFNRGRALLAAVGVAALYWLVQRYLQVSVSDAAGGHVYLVLSLTLSVLGLYILLSPERGVMNAYGLLVLLGGLLLVLLVAFAGPLLPRVSEAAQAYYAPWPLPDYVMSVGATWLVGLVALVGVVLVCLRPEGLEVAILGAFTALYLLLAQLHREHISVAMSLAAALCLLWGLLRSSHRMAYRDDLTGLPGRRALNEHLKVLGRHYSIAMLDVDHFKRCNDTFGHDVGDQVLRLVASRIRRVGAGGTAYRYGGEEFCVVFPRRPLDECVAALEVVREEIGDYRMSLRDSAVRPQRGRDGARKRGASRLKQSEVAVTISAGVACRDEARTNPEAVIAAADKKLYQAKQAGRNRVCY